MDATSDLHTHRRIIWCHLRLGSLEPEVTRERDALRQATPNGSAQSRERRRDPRERLAKALGEKETETDEQEDDPIVLGFFR